MCISGGRARGLQLICYTHFPLRLNKGIPYVYSPGSFAPCIHPGGHHLNRMLVLPKDGVLANTGRGKVTENLEETINGDEPRPGGIYRDIANRSFLVLGVRPNRVFIEYADGHTCSISKSSWPELKAKPALF